MNVWNKPFNPQNPLSPHNRLSSKLLHSFLNEDDRIRKIGFSNLQEPAFSISGIRNACKFSQILNACL